ncbi:MAG TPA: CDP-glycerol glycerophosphotransferase family protein [Mycobacteriales bacterium]|nr:CDP-glycerol glycerophosphotransferase family protein [Mycobacteriales bacterium]
MAKVPAWRSPAARPPTIGPPPPEPPLSRFNRFAVLTLRALRAVVPKDRRRAVLYGVPATNDGIRALLPAVARRGMRCVVISETSDEAERVRVQLGGSVDLIIRRRRSVGAMWQVARAGAVFFTHELYALPPSPRQLMVNLWHGEFTKIIGLWNSTRGCASTYATATSRLGVAFRSAEFGLSPQQVLVVGDPRNDLMLQTSKDAARQELGLPAERRVLLWLPTYRMWPDQRSGPPAPTASDLAAIDGWLAQRNLLLVLKAHPLAPPQPDLVSTENIRILADDADHPVSVARLLAASDGLITDFSSTWCDYLLLDRPIWIHCPDYADLARHGHMLLLPVDRWLPGPLSTTIDELTAAIDAELTGTERAWRERRAWLLDVLHEHKSGSAAERLLDAIDMPTGPSGGPGA